MIRELSATRRTFWFQALDIEAEIVGPDAEELALLHAGEVAPLQHHAHRLLAEGEHPSHLGQPVEHLFHDRTSCADKPARRHVLPFGS